jgi:hypothetical protein
MRTAQRLLSVLTAAVVLGLLGGAALGVLWWRLAPRVPVLIRPDTDPWPGYQPEEYIGADVAFGALALVAGIAGTIALVRIRREHLLGVLVSAVLAGVIGSAVMWFVGTRLGSVDIEGLAATTTENITVDGSLVVTLPGVYVLWPLAAALVVTTVALSDVVRDWRARRANLPTAVLS